jgi:alkylation response protein AidB-like acyl-CoA dehydrogenase
MAEIAPSFARGMFAGEIHDSQLFPYPLPLDRRDAEEAATVRRLLGALQDIRAAGLLDSAKFDEIETLPEETIEALAAGGFLGLSIPKEYGGLGLSPSAYARVFAEVSSMDPSVGVLIGVHCGLGSKAIVLYGNEEQKRRYLPMLARGETLAAYALTEPETGSDAQHIVTKARRNDDGSWTLDGVKHWIGNGQRAGVIATFAQTEVERDGKTVMRPTAFIIRPDMPGFRVVGTVRKMGIRGSTQAELAYESLQVPADHVLGEVGKGFGVAVHVLNGGRQTLAAGCTGGAKLVLDEMVAYAEGRVQFNAPLATFEITQRKFARAASEIYASDAMLGHLSHSADRGDDYSIEAACAKVFASEMVWRAADDLVQIAGGRGFVKPYPYERILRDVRINRIFEGANDVLRLFIALTGIQGPAEQLKEIGDALRSPIQNWMVVAGYASERVKTALGATDRIDVELHPRLKTHKEFFEKHVGELKAAVERAIMKHRKQIVERQLVVERLADMAIDLYATAATLSRTQSFLAERGEEACTTELLLCDLFCVDAGHRFRMNREALASREEEVDATRRAVAEAMRDGKGYLVDDPILTDE